MDRRVRQGQDVVVTVTKNPAIGIGWLKEARQKISAIDLDVLVHLDLTLNPMSHRVAMSRLAPVQACSGHTMSSGIDRKVISYYISWGAAEGTAAQRHYTEKLYLLPNGTLHQYYERRVEGCGTDGCGEGPNRGMQAVDPEPTSKVDGQPFRKLGRKGFDRFAPSDGRWYVCMQQPFKRGVEFDGIVAGIHASDPEARVLLHDVETAESNRTVIQRFLKAGVDLDRVHFLPPQPHHRLLALYYHSDMVLDAFPASGCATSREALEVGALVVTLPAKYLGSRWTTAYYRTIGVTELIATDAADYVEKAVRYALNPTDRAELSGRILKALPALFKRDDAVEAWEEALSKMARGEVEPAGAK